MSKELLTVNNKIVLLDEDTYCLYKDQRWYTTWNKYTRNFYVYNSKKQYLHRLITKAPKGSQVDHINHNTLDNTLSNLRIVTRAQNAHNSKKRNDNTSGYKGVSLCKYTNKWRTTIYLNNKQKTVGRFNTPKEAHDAYVETSGLLFGEYACTGEV